MVNLDFRKLEAQIDLLISELMVTQIEVPEEIYQYLYSEKLINNQQKYKGKIYICKNPPYSKLNQLLVTYINGSAQQMRLVKLFAE